jgi:hypothetical protein
MADALPYLDDAALTGFLLWTLVAAWVVLFGGARWLTDTRPGRMILEAITTPYELPPSRAAIKLAVGALWCVTLILGLVVWWRP